MRKRHWQTVIMSLAVVVVAPLLWNTLNKSSSFNLSNLTSASHSVARVPTPTPTPTLSSSTGTFALVTEPADGVAPVASLIAGAKTSVDLVMYELEDKAIEQDLADAEARGVSVRVLLNEGYYGAAAKDNLDAYNFLKSKNVPVEWTPSSFALTHEKSLVVDRDQALIMTFNLTPQYYASSRDFGVIDKDANDVSAMEKTFDADWGSTKLASQNGDDLVWSPGSTDALVNLISNAKTSIEVYNEEMAYAKIETALEAAAKRGVTVRVVMTDSSDWTDDFRALSSTGVQVRTYSAKAPLYIHAKMILVDGRDAFLGSENFSATSLTKNRELGLTLADPAIISSLNTTFTQDWNGASPF